jgi:RNA polymerase sigma-70 factor, ECF subfamily
MVSVSIDSAAPWEELRGNLRAFIGRRVHNHADADDLVQRVLLQIVNGIGSLRESERLHAWVYRMARNAIIDHYRSSSAQREVPTGDVCDLAAAERPVASHGQDTAAFQELASCLTPMLRQLPDAYRQAVTLADIEGINQADAAQRTGLSLSGMKSRVQRGRKQLKAVLEECCRVEVNRRGAIVAFAPRRPNGCRCDGCDGSGHAR